jgi:hypothetical protein
MFKKLSKIKPKGGKFEDFYLLAHLCSVSVIGSSLLCLCEIRRGTMLRFLDWNNALSTRMNNGIIVSIDVNVE